MNVLIVEDEDISAQNLKKILADHDPAIAVLAIIQSIKDLKKWVQSGQLVDLIFCDIELRDGNVLSYLQYVSINAVVVFTTAYDRFWKTALQSNGIDYLLKPIDEKKVHAVLNKISSLKKILAGGNRELITELTRYMDKNISRNYKKRFPVKLNNEVFILDIEDIMFFKIVNGVILAHTNGQKKLPVTEETINELEAILNPEVFFRINRSELVNIEYIESIQLAMHDDYRIKLKNTHIKLVVSNSRITHLKSWINL